MNQYFERDGYIVGTTEKGNEFLFDKEDFDIVKLHHWKISSGRMVTKINGKWVPMSKVLFGNKPSKYKNGNHKDNRKQNVRPAYTGRILVHGYYAVYKPGASGCGKALEDYFYEHVLVAESAIGRRLQKGEVVHHKDKNKANNNPDNLMVFKSTADHIRFHWGAEAVLLDDGSYSTVRKNKRTTERANRSRRTISREDLLEEVKNNSFEAIGRKYGVTGKSVSKWCKKDGIPYKRRDIKRLAEEGLI